MKLGSKVALLISLLVTVAICSPAAFGLAQTAGTEPLMLEPGVKVQREIEGGDKHIFQAKAAAGEVMRVIVRQRGVDLSVRVFSAQNQPVDVIDRSGIGEWERVLLVADSPAIYRIEVEPSGKSPGMSYEIEIEEIRRATQNDRLAVSGLRVLRQAEQFYLDRRTESLPKAVEKFEEAIKLLQSGADAEGQAMALIMLGLSHRTMGDNLKALECYTRALPLCREARMLHKESAALNNIAGIYHSRGQVEKAQEYYTQAVSILRQLGDKVAEAIVLNNLGTIGMSLGDHQQALNHLRQALVLRRAVGDVRGEAITLNNFAYIYGELGDLQAAIKSLEEALARSQQSKDRRLEATTLNNLGMAYRLVGDYRQAKSHIERALTTLADSSTPATEMVALNNLGAAHLKLGETQKAIERFEQALKLARALEERHREASILSNLGMAYRELRQPDAALGHLSQALKLRRLVGDRPGEADTLHVIALVERDKGRLLESRSRSEEAIGIVESLRSRVGSQNLRTAYLASKRDYYELLIETLMHLDRQSPSGDYSALALRVSEQARARTMVDTIAETRADIRQGVDRDLLERERGLQQLINARETYRTQFAASSKTQQQAQEIEEEIKRLIAEYQEVQEQIRLKSPRYASLTQPATLGLKEIQRLLDGESLLLEYSLGRSASFLWIVTDRSATSFTLPPREEIEEAARRVYESLTARNRRVDGETPIERRVRAERADVEYRIAAMELSRMLLGPAASHLNRKRVVIVAEGALQYIPFAALPAPVISSEKSKGTRSLYRPAAPPGQRPLILSHEIVSLPSASALAVLRKGATEMGAPAKLVAVFADPVFGKDDPRIMRASSEHGAHADITQQAIPDVERSARESGISGFRRLHFTRFEAEAISSLAPRATSLKAVDFEASRQKATSEELNQYSIIHFATHGLLNNETPELTGLVLSLVDERGNPVDGFLRLHEIYNLRLNADLVVLSACQTALGKEIKGEGLVGLTRGFMYAGARSVLASLWSVEDRGTAELMKRFYRRIIADRMKPADALRATQAEMSSLRQWASPYYWAAFVIQGEWR